MPFLLTNSYLHRVSFSLLRQSESQSYIWSALLLKASAEKTCEWHVTSNILLFDRQKTLWRSLHIGLVKSGVNTEQGWMDISSTLGQHSAWLTEQADLGLGLAKLAQTSSGHKTLHSVKSHQLLLLNKSPAQFCIHFLRAALLKGCDGSEMLVLCELMGSGCCLDPEGMGKISRAYIRKDTTQELPRHSHDSRHCVSYTP